MSRRLLDLLLALLAFCSAMRLWQYYVGVRLAIYDIILLAFTGVFVLRILFLGGMPLPVKALRPALVCLWGILLLSALSFFILDFSFAPASTTQFVKELVQLLLYATGFTAVVCFLSEAPESTARRILQAYILGAAASSFYSFFELTFAYYGHDLGKAVFGRISTYPPDFDWTAPFYYEWDVFYRAVGFTGVNAQATYTASVIPLLLLARPFRSRLVNLALAALCIAGTALTFSRNGVVSLCVAFALYAVVRPRWTLRLMPRIIIVFLPALFLALIFSDGARKMISTRLYTSLDQIGVGRFEIYESAWQSIKKHPFGHGINQFSIVVKDSDEIDLSKLAVEYYMWDDAHLREAYANLHNNWLNWLFEGGWPLLIAQLAYYGTLLHVCWRARTDLGLAAFCALIMLLFSGSFNMTLDLFSTELLFIILPVCVALESRPQLLAFSLKSANPNNNVARPSC